MRLVMKSVLFIGSVVLDMVVQLDHLPKLKEDINTEGMKLSVGGCSRNACQIVKHFGLPTISCSPIGTGPFASLLQNMLDEEPIVKLDNQDNGCCICLVNKDGERTFLSEHGAEYLFDEKWLQGIDSNDLDYIYVCGLEIEDKNGEQILDYLENMNVKVFFAPGSRIMHIQPERMKRILNLKPIIHLNEDEALQFTKCETVKNAATEIHRITNELVIITCGERGVYYKNSSNEKLIPGFKSVVVDTIGAGDSHAGACIAGLMQNKPIDEVLKIANKIACKVISVEGAGLTKEEFKEVLLS